MGLGFPFDDALAHELLGDVRDHLVAVLVPVADVVSLPTEALSSHESSKFTCNNTNSSYSIPLAESQGVGDQGKGHCGKVGCRA